MTLMATLTFESDPWRYTVLTLGALALGVSMGVTRASWKHNYRYFWANLGVSMLILSMVVTTVVHLDSQPAAAVYIEIAGTIVYLFGNALLHRRAMLVRHDRRVARVPIRTGR